MTSVSPSAGTTSITSTRVPGEMPLSIYNTLTRRKDPLIPVTDGQVKIYVCGPTVNDDPHLGHARSAVVFDVLRRYLKALGYRVLLVRNITDIDDKIIAKALRENENFRILGARYLRRYRQALKRLNVEPANAQPKATDFIRPIQDFISGLLQRGHAYVAGGNVYFSVASFKLYGRLSGRSPGSSAVDRGFQKNGKKHPADFVLWKAARTGEPFWPSPWGAGRPGWHIECSAMSARLLGPVYDIHGGGEDLIFPHHENEIAQSESLFNRPPANCWMHHGLVTHADGGKISKSKGRFERLNDLLDIYPADALRLFLLSKRYRHPTPFSHLKMEAVLKNLLRIHRFLLRADVSAAGSAERIKPGGVYWMRFCAAMDDDANFPLALAVVFEGIRTIQRAMAADITRPHAPISKNHQTAIHDLRFICREVLGMGSSNISNTAIARPDVRPVAAVG